MVAVPYVRRKDERRYVRQVTRETKQGLIRYPITSMFIGNLTKLKDRRPHTIHNAIFWMASSSLTNALMKERLCELEKAFRVFGAKKWHARLRNDVKGRLCSPRAEACISVLDEMDVALTLKNKAKGKVIPYPKHPSKGPDVSAVLLNRDIFFEITNVVETGEKELRLIKICRGIAKGLFDRITTNMLLHADIDTTKLVWTKGRLRINQSVRKALVHVDRLKLALLFPKYTHFDLREATGWRDPLVESSPLRSFLRDNSGFKVVEVSPAMESPSEAHGKEQAAYLARVETAILKKVRKGQLQHGFPNVLVVRASNWTFGNYGQASPLTFDLQCKSLKDRIRTVLNSNRIHDLSAIMFFDDRFRDAWVVGNRFADAPSKLSASEYASLYGRKRIQILKKTKIENRIRRRIIPEKVSLCASTASRGYERTSIIKRVCSRRIYDALTDLNLKLVQLGMAIEVSKTRLRDPGANPDCSESGRTISMIEEKHLIDRILQNSKSHTLKSFDFEDLDREEKYFKETVGPATALFVPLTLFIQIHEWMDFTTLTPRWKYVGSQMFIVFNDQTCVPIHWLTKEFPEHCLILYNKQIHGEWVYARGNYSDALSFNLRKSRDKQRLRIVVNTEAFYIIFEEAGAVKLTLSGD